MGGATVPVPDVAEPTDANIAGVELLPAAEAAEDGRKLADASAPPTVLASAMAPPPMNAPVETRSPPESAGDPPRTAANSFGICQHNIMKMIEAPMISSADIAGLELDAIFSASDIQSTERLMPVPIRRYRSMILTPVETPSPI